MSWAKPQTKLTHLPLEDFKEILGKYFHDNFSHWCLSFFLYNCPLMNVTGLNSSPPSAAYMRQWTVSTSVQVMACRLFGVKPLPEPMLAYCHVDPREQISVKFKSEFYHFHSRKCIWNCRLPKWRPLCPGGDELTDDKSILVQVMAWNCLAPSHYHSQCWSSSMFKSNQVYFSLGTYQQYNTNNLTQYLEKGNQWSSAYLAGIPVAMWHH